MRGSWPARLTPLLAAAASVVAVAAALTTRPGTTATSVILVSIDTLRADHLGAYGYERPTTPRIDAFSREGVLFEQSIAAAPSTLSSHASMLTSLVAPHHGASMQRGTALASAHVTLAEILREHGHATASWNGGSQLHRLWGLDQGFDLYHSVPGAPSGEEPVDALHRLEPAVRKALEWIDGLGGSRPFFVFLHTYETHYPFAPEQATRGLFPSYDTRLGERVSFDDLQRFNRGDWKLAPGDLGHIVACYDAEIRSADRGFGVLLDGLAARGLDDRTLVVLTSDHGEEFHERASVGRHGHTLFDELLLVPLIVRFPDGRHHGRRVSAQVAGIDVAPTILDALGISPPPVFQGSSLLQLLQGEAPPASGPMLSALDNERDVLSLRDDGWKWLRGSLFDLRRDPAEKVNLRRASPDGRARGRAMKRRVDRWLAARPRVSAPVVHVEGELVEQLHALGYLDVPGLRPASSNRDRDSVPPGELSKGSDG